MTFLQGFMTLAVLILLGGMATGYQAGLVPVALVVDGVSHQVHTPQETVGALLLDAGLELYPEDVVEPAMDTVLEPEMTVRVARARPVSIEVDGQTWQVRTHARDAAQVLAEAGVSLSASDRLIAESGSPESGPPVRIMVKRAVPVLVQEDEQTLALHTTADTVGEALEEAGFDLYLADRVEPRLGEPLVSGLRIQVERSQPVVVQADGRTVRTRTHRDQVDQVLADLGIVLTGQDYTLPPLDAPVDGDTFIEVVRVSERFVVRQEPIPFNVVWQPDPELELDNQRLLQEGAPGVRERWLRVRYENGREVSRILESDTVAVPPTTKTLGYGTRIVIRELETPDGTLEYWRVIHMLATSYSASTAGTPRTSPYYGFTRLGWPMRHGLVAVDPRVVALRTRVWVAGYGVGIAADTGGAIKGRRIDLGYDDDNLRLWYNWVDVYLLTPVPPADEINYTIGQ